MKKTDEIIFALQVLKKGRYSVRDLLNLLPTPRKRLWYLLQKWSDKDWYDYGVNLELGWLTDKGIAEFTKYDYPALHRWVRDTTIYVDRLSPAMDNYFRRRRTQMKLYDVLEQVQPEQNLWSAKNFPNSTPIDPTLGLSEEYGELQECFNYFDTHLTLLPDTGDAFADIVIYACDLAGKYKVSLAGLYRDHEDAPYANRERCRNAVGISIGKISHHMLKLRQGIRGTQEEHIQGMKVFLGKLLNALEQLAGWYHLSLAEEVHKAWTETVSKRDWQSNKESGKV